LDISFAFGVSSSNFYQHDGVLWPTLAAINDALTIGFPLNDPVMLDRMAKGFAKCSHGRMTGCVLAVDGIVIRTRAPIFHKEVDNVGCFYNRKGFYGLVVMAGCDSNLKFHFWSAKSPGSTHDCIAWEYSTLYASVFARNRLPAKYYAVGDEAFVNTNNFLCPFPGRNIGVYKDSFNYHLSSMRQCIERAFGVLVKRWGILWRNLQCSYERWTMVLTVCAKLHNLCIDATIDVEEFGYQPDDVDYDDTEQVITTDEPNIQHEGDEYYVSSRVVSYDAK
jgi:hypothetical protein